MRTIGSIHNYGPHQRLFTIIYLKRTPKLFQVWHEGFYEKSEQREEMNEFFFL